MNQNSCLSVSEPTSRRLPVYHRVLAVLRNEGVETVSCTRIARALDLDPTQVRKDLAVTGITGKPKVGYDLIDLVRCIESFLGWNNVTEAFLVGTGNLGAALLGFDGFRRYGMRIVAAFDADEMKVGTVIHGCDVLHVSKLSDLSTRMSIQIGVLTTPAEVAQKTADAMVAGGIRAIWNFTPTHLEVPENVIVENQDLSVGLAVLSHRLYEQLRRDAAENLEASVTGNE